jgi:predicted anti-sigma-YlaC factor YlaD
MCYSTGSLQAYLEGEVTAGEKAEIEEHLAACRLCMEKYSEIRQNQAFTNSMLSGYMQLLGRGEVDIRRPGTALKASTSIERKVNIIKQLRGKGF